jgi:cytochrome P450
MLLVGLFPSLLARKGYAGRERIIRGFQKYFAAEGHKLGSELVKARFKSLTAYGISPEDIARFETVNGFGILINTLPTAFWSLYHTFSDPKLLAIVRELSLPTVSTSVDESGRELYTLDVRHIRDIAILVSIIHESLRYHTSGAAPRMVMEDFILDDKYLLKKGNMLLTPNREIHFNEAAWGKTVDQFDALRFAGDDSQRSKKPPPGAFRGFGSGVNLCPGKAFATTEILAILALMALRFDIDPVSGSWDYPGDNGDNMSTVVCVPSRPIPVRITPRKEYARGTWKIKAMDE